MNLGETSLKRNFLYYVIPSVLSQWVYAVYTMVDGMFVAKGAGPIAMTAVNLSSPFLQFLFAISLLFAAGTSTVAAIFMGNGKRRQASEVFTQTVMVQIVLSAAIIAAVLPNLKLLVQFLGARDGVTAVYVEEYLSWIIPFLPGFLLSYAFEVLLKLDGFPQKTVVIVLTGAIENCVLDWLFVIVLQEGVGGAAFATSLSQCTVTLLYLHHFLQQKGTIFFVKFQFRPLILLRAMRNGTSAALTELSAGLVTLIFNQAIAALLFQGALVSYAIVSYMNSIVVFSITGIVQGSQPLISYYYGQRNSSCCRQLLRCCLVSSLIFCAGTMSICGILTPGIVSFYIGSELPELQAYSVPAIRIFILSFLPLGLNIALSGYLAAVERALPALIIALGRSFVFLLLSLILLTGLLGGAGIWWAPLLSETLCLIMACALLLVVRRRIFCGEIGGSEMEPPTNKEESL